jgi:elongation factor G
MDVPVLSLTITPHTEGDQERLRAGLAALMAEDLTIHVQPGPQAGEITIGVMGELQLEIICERLKREFDVDASVGKPEVAYKVALTQAADGEMKYARQEAGRGQYAHVKIHLFPGVPGTGYLFENTMEGEAIPITYIKSIEDGIQEVLARGALEGHPIDDVRIELYGGSHHEVDSSELAFRIAGSLAFQDAAKKAKPVLLEPVMSVEVNVPREYVGDVRGNLASRRGQIDVLDDRGATQIVRARVPMSFMFGYASDLRERTLGRATFTSTFDRYEPVGAGPDENDDRHSYVGWPVTPRPPLKNSAIALPEPD